MDRAPGGSQRFFQIRITCAAVMTWLSDHGQALVTDRADSRARYLIG